MINDGPLLTLGIASAPPFIRSLECDETILPSHLLLVPPHSVPLPVSVNTNDPDSFRPSAGKHLQLCCHSSILPSLIHRSLHNQTAQSRPYWFHCGFLVSWPLLSLVNLRRDSNSSLQRFNYGNIASIESNLMWSISMVTRWIPSGAMFRIRNGNNQLEMLIYWFLRGLGCGS